MTLDLLDKELAAWQQAARDIINNVYGLYEHTAYQTLAGARRSGGARTSGLTRQRVEAALGAVKDLLDLSLILDGVVKRAAELRADLPLLFHNGRLHEIEQLLTGPSIRMPDAETPLAMRGLLSHGVSARSLTPRELLDLMLPAFDAAKSAILAVEDVWTRLPAALDALQAEAQELKRQAEAEVLSASFDVPEILRKVHAARAALSEDPLGAATEMEAEIRSQLALFRNQLQSCQAERRRISDELRAAGAEMDGLRALWGRADAAQAERLLKVELSDPHSVPAVPALGKMTALGAWHAKLQATVNGPEWRPARIGLEKWLLAAGAARADCEEALRVHELALSSRRELRGRLEAMKAKAAACGFAEDAELGAFERDAMALFLRRPTPFHEAERLVAAYQRGLASRTLSPR